jgi:hypothetical protein
MQIDCNKQTSKHDSSIRFNLDSDSNEIDCSSENAKHDVHSLSTELGMQIDCKKHDSKHDPSISFNLDPGSKLIDPISFSFLWPPLKQEFERISTELGMQIDCKKHNLKHDLSIRFNFDPDSNMKDIILFGFHQQPLKHDLHIISTELGMQIVCNEQHRKHDSSIRFNRDSDSNEIDCRFEYWKWNLGRGSNERAMQIRWASRGFWQSN